MARAIPPGYHAEYLAAIVDSSEDVIVSKTLDGTIISWNPAAKKIFGYTAEEAIGKHITLIIPSERWSEEEEVLARLRRGERIEHFETIRRTKDGRILNISLTVSPIRDEMGKIVGASKIARDITERKRAEAMIAADLAAMKRLHQIGSLCARGQTSLPQSPRTVQLVLTGNSLSIAAICFLQQRIVATKHSRTTWRERLRRFRSAVTI